MLFRSEYRALVEALRLPVSERAKARIEGEKALAATAGAPANFEHMAGE